MTHFILWVGHVDSFRCAGVGAASLVQSPPASTKSRARYREPEGQKPLRPRSKTFGLHGLGPKETSKIQEANQQCEITAWFDDEALSCLACKIAVVTVSTEDFAGHLETKPTATTALKERQAVEDPTPTDVRAFSASSNQKASPGHLVEPLVDFNILCIPDVLDSGGPQMRFLGSLLLGPCAEEVPLQTCSQAHKKIASRG